MGPVSSAGCSQCRGQMRFLLVECWSCWCCFLFFEEFLDLCLPCPKNHVSQCFLHIVLLVTPPAPRFPETLTFCPAPGCARSRAPAALPGLLGRCPALPCPAWSPQAVTAPRAGGQLPEARGVCGCLLVVLPLRARLEWGSASYFL